MAHAEDLGLLSAGYRVLFWLLLGLIVFGLVGLFLAIPGGNVIYAVLGLVIFGGYTVLDFNRMRRAGMDEAVPIAPGSSSTSSACSFFSAAPWTKGEVAVGPWGVRDRQVRWRAVVH